MNTITHHHQELYQLKDIDLPNDFVYLPPGPTQGRKGATQELAYKQPLLNSI
jgi:ribulose 1,5-bisphosphate carboxylase large subunit-like protein